MATVPLTGVLRSLHRAALLHDDSGRSDGQLLEDFVARRDQAAFAALLRRHGPMVLGVCRRVLGHEQDAEDAFQAAFLVLARKAASLRRRELVGNWLYGVAYRAALEGRGARGRVKERPMAEAPEPGTADDAAVWKDLRPVLDRELSRLPDKYRLAVVLCDLEGRTRRDAARELGVPEGTLSGRLTTARRTLARRLAQRGLALSGGALAAALSQAAASACPPAALVVSTSEAAVGVAAGGAASVVSGKIAAVMEGVLKAMLLRKVQTVSAALLTAALAVLGVGLLACRPAAVSQAAEKKADDAPPADKKGPDKGPAPWEVKATLEGHKDRVLSVAFSRDGKRLASASNDGAVKLWDPAAGKELLTLEWHDGPVYQVAFAPDGKALATAGADRTARVWDAAKGTELHRLAHDEPVQSVAFSPDGKVLAAGGGGVEAPTAILGVVRPPKGELRLWDPATGKLLAQVEGHKNCVVRLAFTPDGKTLLSGDHDNVFKVWDVDAKGQLAERFAVELKGTQRISGMALAPDGKTLAVSGDRGITLYDVVSGKPCGELEVKKGDGEWGDLAFAPDGKTVASVTTVLHVDDDVREWRGLVQLWDAGTGKVLQAVKVGHPVHSLAVSPDGRTLAVGCRGKIPTPIKGEFRVGDREEEDSPPLKLLAPKK
jgi:RNA polymerase sigma factor (sigma-70 family)